MKLYLENFFNKICYLYTEKRTELWNSVWLTAHDNSSIFICCWHVFNWLRNFAHIFCCWIFLIFKICKNKRQNICCLFFCFWFLSTENKTKRNQTLFYFWSRLSQWQLQTFGLVCFASFSTLVEWVGGRGTRICGVLFLFWLSQQQQCIAKPVVILFVIVADAAAAAAVVVMLIVVAVVLC